MVCCSRRILSLVMFACCLAAAAGSPALALTRAPKSPAFTRYCQGASTVAAQPQAADDLGTGLVPPPVDLSHARGKRVMLSGRGLLSLPTAYDLRASSPARLTGVRNQGGCGSCWAFASYGSLESCLLPSVTTDFSENHLKNTAGFDWGPCEGGNHFMTTAYLARWSGPVNESSDPYNPAGGVSPTGLAPVYHVQNVDFLPNRAGPLDNDNIKQAVMTSGAVYTSLYITESSAYFSSTTKSLYYTGSADANHAVCIVGWDDNYPRSSFPTPPPGDGAFIAKNSWGSYWGAAGFFYVSYYDTKVGNDNVVFNNAESVTNYDHIYDYDPLGWTDSLGYEGTTAWFANVFHAVSDSALRAVSFYTGSPGSLYEVYVYRDPDSGPLNTSGCSTSITGTIPEMGYHTLALPAAVPLTSGQAFSVVVKLTTPDYNYPIPCEVPDPGYSSRATADAGQSYVSPDGVLWSDLTDSQPGSNVCVKAFADGVSGLAVSPGSGFSAEGVTGGPFSPPSQMYTLTNIGAGTVQWSASCTQGWVGLSATGGALGPGESTTVTVSIDPSAANGLPSGVYTDAVLFANLTSGVGNTSKSVTLSIYDPYEVRSAAFGWIDPSSHTVLPLGDDDTSAGQMIPFAFSFYGKPCSQVYVKANGVVTFVSDTQAAYENTELPSTAAPNAALYPYWDDLNPAAGGSVRVGTVGAAPNRKLVVSWVGVPLYASAATTLSFQVVLCEGSHDIVFQYLDVKPDDIGFGAGRSATVGVENDKGSVATGYSYNGGTLLRDRMALLFTSRGPTIATTKACANGTAVSLRRAIVTSVLGDVFYIESDDRSSGTRVVMPGHGVSRWDRVDVSGVVTTNLDGERCIDATYVSTVGVGGVAPVAMNGAVLGGGDLSYDASAGTGQEGLSAWRRGGADSSRVGISGLNNIGLLVRTWGRVTWSQDGVFYIDDGCMLSDDSGHVGVRVEAPGLSAPSVGSFVCVTGISSCFRSDGNLYRRILVMSQDDVAASASPRQPDWHPATRRNIRSG